MDSQYFDNDEVYSVVPRDDDQEYSNISSEYQSSVPAPTIGADDERPDLTVKACKNMSVVFIHDLSGSMEPNIGTMVTGTNEFIQDLQGRYAQPCNFTARFLLITFAGDRITVGNWCDVMDVVPYTRANFKCDGSTPLWDACNIGLDKILTDCSGQFAAIYAFTDGDDNNSKNATRDSIRKKIATLDPNIQTMLFIGSDPMSSSANAEYIGLDRQHSLNPSSDSTPSAMRACTNTIARCVTGETQTPEFSQGDILMSEGS